MGRIPEREDLRGGAAVWAALCHTLGRACAGCACGHAVSCRRDPLGMDRSGQMGRDERMQADERMAPSDSDGIPLQIAVS